MSKTNHTKTSLRGKNSRRSSNRTEVVLIANRRTIIHWEDDATRDLPPYQPRKMSYRTVRAKYANSPPGAAILKSTVSEGIIIGEPKEAKLSLEIYADASYGGEGAGSQTGALMTLGGQPVGWYSWRQDIIALSVTETEYIADCEGVKNAAWGEQFLKELHISLELPILKTDSEEAYNLSQTSKFLRRSCHIERRYYYLRQQAQPEKLVIPRYPDQAHPMSSIIA